MQQSPKSEVLQNCDLPPPIKLFQSKDVMGNESLLRALRISQKRAREAEMKEMEAMIEAQQIAALMFKESKKLQEAKCLVAMLEMEISSRRRLSSVGGGNVVFALCLGVTGAAGFIIGRYLY